MKAKHQRLMYVVCAGAVVALAVTLMARAFNEHLIFFYSPADIVSLSAVQKSRTIRLGGLVVVGSVKSDGANISFLVTDNKAELPVQYTGALPALFREGQGVVAEGQLQPEGFLKAKTILAKHDENYMPPEVADALKKNGQWKQAKPEIEPSLNPMAPMNEGATP